MEKNCPCCNRHCPADQLSCPTGREHFGIKEESRHSAQPSNPNEQMIILLRKCGHFLHHNLNQDSDTTPLTEALSAEERATLESLLEKCLEHWNNLPKNASEH